ncbi:MAG: hypothetical protein PUD63_12490 [Clostridia bacterium]|nr:hypothetical protein [Clostridia bacterium]
MLEIGEGSGKATASLIKYDFDILLLSRGKTLLREGQAASPEKGNVPCIHV